jgi:acetoin utilization deacetylase AcuC-like enzyme
MFRSLFSKGKSRLAVAYHESYILSQAFDAEGLFDPLRPFRIREGIVQSRFAKHLHWLPVEPATPEDLARIHSPAYLQRAQLPAFLAEVYSLHRIDPWDTEIWDAVLHATGGTIAAVDHALRTGNTAANLSGGFHHAAPEQAAGFCVINDVAVAVARLRATGFREPIAVVDLDYHHGDGTELCLRDDALTWNLSVHPGAWQDTGKTQRVHRIVSVDAADDTYLDVVREALAALNHVQPQLVIYVAGVDPWREDRLTNMLITEEGLLRRDRLVQGWAASHGAPLALVTAGGYGPDAWRPTANFLKHVLAGEKP